MRVHPLEEMKIEVIFEFKGPTPTTEQQLSQATLAADATTSKLHGRLNVRARPRIGQRVAHFAPDSWLGRTSNKMSAGCQSTESYQQAQSALFEFGVSKPQLIWDPHQHHSAATLASHASDYGKEEFDGHKIGGEKEVKKRVNLLERARTSWRRVKVSRLLDR